MNVVQDPWDSRRFGWTGIDEDGSLCGVAMISPSGVDTFSSTWRAEPEVGWSGNPVWSGNKALVTTTRPMSTLSEYEGGLTLEEEKLRRQKVCLKIFNNNNVWSSSAERLLTQRPLMPPVQSVPLCNVATCMASHPLTDDLFCGTEDGIICVYKNK